MDSLSEESKLLYDMIMSETDEIYEAKFASYRARALAAASTATSTTRSTTTIGAPSGTTSREYCHEQASATSSPTSAQAISTIRSTAASACAAASTRVPAAASLDSSPALVLSRPTATAPTTPGVSHLVLSFERDSTEDDFTPEAQRFYDLLVGGSASQAPASTDVSTVPPSPLEVEDVQDAVDIGATDLAASSPTTCSAECPGHDASVYAAVTLIPSTTPNSSMTTGDVVLEFAASVICAETLPVDATWVAARPQCSINCLDGEFGAPFPASLNTHALLLKPPPTAAAALSPRFTVEVQTTLSLATISAGIISFDREDSLVREESLLEKDVSWTIPSEALIIQLLKSYVHSEPQTMMPSVYTTICFETDMDVPMSMFIQDLHLNIKQQGHVLRPLPWPPFKYHSEKVCALEPCSESEVPRQGEHLQLWLLPNGVFSWKLGANGRILSYEKFSSTNVLLLPRDTTKLQPWPPPPSIHGYLPGPQKQKLFTTGTLPGKMCLLLGCRSPTLTDVGLRTVCLQIEQLKEAKFPGLMYPFAHSATLHHRFLCGDCTLLSSTTANYAMVQYIHWKGPPDPDESDCVASRYFVDVLLCFRLGEQPSACAVMFQTYTFYSTTLSSWKDTMLVVNQWVLTRCISSFDMDLVLHGYNSRDLSFWRYPSVDKMVLKSGHIIQCCPESTQWNIAWSLQLEYLDFGYQLRQLSWDPGDVLAQHLLNVTRPQAPILVRQPVDMSSSFVLVPQKKCHILWDPGGYYFQLFDYNPEHILISIAINKDFWGRFLSKIPWSIKSECSDVNQTKVHQTRQLIPACALTIPNSMHLHFSLESYLVICYLEIEIRSLDVNFIPLLHLPWDPGGMNHYRLEDKPNFMGEGLSATELLDWPVGRQSWAVACSRAR